MKNKKISKALMAAVIAIVVVSCLVGAGQALIHVSPENFDSWVREQSDHTVNEINRFVSSELSYDIYQEYKKSASTDEQLRALDELASESSTGTFFPRKAKQIIDELTEDAPRITLRDAEVIANQGLNLSEIMAQFDQIAGAPDTYGGSGMLIVEYYLDDNGTEIININSTGLISYHNGETAKLLGDQNRMPFSESSQSEGGTRYK